MAIYYKFRSEKELKSLSIEGPFISVGLLKKKIMESKIFKTRSRNSRHIKDVLVLVDAQSNQEYVDDQTLIPKCTSLVICRFPRFPCKHTLLTPAADEEEEDSKTTDNLVYGIDFDDFGEDVYHVAPTNETKTQPLANTNTNTASLDRRPHEGYVCRRCRIPGHFIQHCPTNGDPNFDIRRRIIPPTAIPTATSNRVNGSVMEQNRMEMIHHLPELNCPLCKQVMKDAVLTSKCCFRSFCDKCIRDRFISIRTCVCGATDRLADQLVPNNTLRETIINRETKCTTSSGSRDRDQVSATPPRVLSKRGSSSREDEYRHHKRHRSEIVTIGQRFGASFTPICV